MLSTPFHLCPWLAVLMTFTSIAVADEVVYFGTTGNNANVPAGVYQANLASDGNLSAAILHTELNGAGWVTGNPKKPGILYSTGESSVVSIKNGEILNSQPVKGGSCFLTTDQTGAVLLSAHYGAGTVTVFPINENGSLGEQSQRIQHEGGSKVVGNRQDSPHPHCVCVSPDNRFVFVPDLGLDQLIAYQLDVENEKLNSHPTHPRVDVELGGGPRHMKFHPNQKFAFVLNELSLAVTVFEYDAERGILKKVATVPALTAEEKSENESNSGSEIRVSNSGEYVYSANRGHDSISVFSFDPGDGNLKRIQVEPVRGSWPRNFNLSPDGKLLLAAARGSNSVSTFTIRDDGKLRHRDHQSIFVPGPICVTFGG